MAWDKTRPDGSIVAVSQADDLIRENNDSLETAMDVEHAFATGGTQTGRHQFGFGTVAARDAIADLLIDGALWIVTGGSIPSGFGELVMRNQTGLQWLDLSGRQFLQLTNKWTAAQRSGYNDLGSVSGAVASDWDLSNYFKATLTGDITLSNPTNKPAADDAGGWTYQLTQDGVGGHTLTLGSEFKTQFGVTPTLTPTANAVDLLVCTLLSNGDIWAELVSDVK